MADSVDKLTCENQLSRVRELSGNMTAKSQAIRENQLSRVRELSGNMTAKSQAIRE
jgi:hypothetical protein